MHVRAGNVYATYTRSRTGYIRVCKMICIRHVVMKELGGAGDDASQEVRAKPA